MRNRPVLLSALFLTAFYAMLALPASGSDSKSDCAKQGSGSKQKPKDCDNLGSGRMSTKEKADKSDMTSASNKTGTASSSSGSDQKTQKSDKSEKNDKTQNKVVKKEPDPVSKDRMSTRGMKTPEKDTEKSASDNPK